jgi:hypothetical protein
MCKVNRRRMPSDGKRSHCLWQGELKKQYIKGKQVNNLFISDFPLYNSCKTTFFKTWSSNYTSINNNNTIINHNWRFHTSINCLPVFLWYIAFLAHLVKGNVTFCHHKQELPVVAMFVNGSGQNVHSLERTFYRCFLPSFSSCGWGVSEEKIKMWKVKGHFVPIH